MIIVSQDKCTIVNLDNIKTIELDRETDFKSIIIFCIVSAIATLMIWGIVELIKLIRRFIWKIKLK